MERGIRRLQKLRERRQKAVALFEQGERQATVAQILRVSKQSVSQWYLAWQNGDLRRLNGATRAGRKPRLQADQLALIEKELLRGAAAQGFATDLWTLPRVADLIRKLTGVSYHAGHAWKILKLMGWSLQRPTLRAKERDEAAVQQWNTQTWAKVKKTPKTATHG
ncbi:MAG: winged helix-turn-helix domain-containing protein [Spirochaetia bacterium]|jgi:transposase